MSVTTGRLPSSSVHSGPLATLESAWWNESTAPPSRIPFEAVYDCIPQISELGGKKSCALTALLNAWVLSRALSGEEADHVQTTVANDSDYSQCWIDLRLVAGYYAWSVRPMDTAQIVGNLLGKHMSLQVAKSSELPKALERGHAVTIANYEHTRIAFQPQVDGQVVVCDTMFTELQGNYTLPEVTNSRVQYGGRDEPLFIWSGRPIVIV
jgi:hypothetical protein